MPADEHRRVRETLKRYRRKKSLREVGLLALWIIAAIVPFWLGFNRAETLIWFVGVLCLASFEQQRQHIRAIQVRLAEMHDTLNKVAGEEMDDPNGNLLSELSSA
jgi:hypothetical protein